MSVTIMGAGNMGRGTGHRLVAGGHDVTVMDRDAEKAERLAELRNAWIMTSWAPFAFSFPRCW